MFNASSLSGRLAELRNEVNRLSTPVDAGGDDEAGEAETESMAFTSLRPTQVITSETELDGWLSGIKQRLLERIRAGKKIRLIKTWLT